MESNDSFIASQGNWVKFEKGGGQKIYRYIAETATHVWVMEIGAVKDGAAKIHRPPATRTYRREWRKADVTGWLKCERLRHIEDRGIRKEMLDASTERGVDDSLDMKRDLIAFVQKEFGTSYRLTEKGYQEAVNLAASVFEVSKPTARRWLEYDLFYGGHPNANMAHEWSKGGPGQPRRGLTDSSGRLVPVLGRPTDAELINPDTPFKRQRCTPNKYAAWTTFVEKQAWDTNDRIRVILDRYKLMQVGHNRDTDGVLRAYPARRNLPSDSYLTQIARPILRRVREERKIARSYQVGYRRVLAGGQATQLADEDLSVLDIDATIADNFISFAGEDVYIDGCGKPTVLLAIDRESDAISGWYVTFGYENGDCYRRCVFSAYTPKERELARWGVPHLLPGMVFGCASKIFVDRGPGISEKMLQSIIDGLRNDLIMARPADPAGKGHVEGVMGWFQNALSNILGSTHKTGDEDVDREKRLTAKKVAVTLDVFMAALLTAIARRNLELDVRHLLTDKMLKAVKPPRPVPVEIYDFNKRQRGGDFDWDWPEETIFRRLNTRHDGIKAPNGIITIDCRQYTSPMLRTLAKHHENMTGGKSLVVTAYEMANAPLVLLWDDPAGNLQALEATAQTSANYGDTFKWMHDFVSRLKNRALASALAASKKVIDAAARSSAAELSKAKQKVLKDAAARSGSVAPAVPAVEARRRAKTIVDRDDVNQLLEDFGTTTLPARPTRPSPKPDGGGVTIDDDVFTDF
ncbi:hypothetical protein [Paraburkholderia youngii]|uniref:hypothetical protein n=1 Tax=Paraburkholderia youngii TaxID=2782701 RepID=UPI003D1A056E